MAITQHLYKTMIQRFFIFSFAFLFAVGCSDPISVDSEIEGPVAESRRFTPPDDTFRKLTIAEFVQLQVDETGEFSILLAALSRVNLVGAFEGKKPLTVFAPTNAAFIALLDELGANSLDDISDETLTAVLLYHVVPGRRVASIVLNSNKLHTLNGAKLKVDADNVALIDANGRSAGIVNVDFAPRNGIVHVINKVVLPPLN